MSMKKRFQCLTLALVVTLAGIGFTGCAGQYALFNRAHPAIGNLGGRWVGAVVFWIIGGPVLGITLFADTFIFNVIEFWTGNNLIAAGGSFEQIDEHGNRLAAVKNDDGTLSVNVTKITGETTDYLLTREGNYFSIFDADGILLSSYASSYTVAAWN